MFHSHLKHQARQKEHKDLAMAALIFLLRLIVIPPPHTTAVVIRIVCLHVREQFLDLPIAASPCLYIASTISRAAVKPILASHLIPFPFCIRRSLWDFEGPQTRNPPCIYFEVFLRDFIESCSDLLKPFVIFFHQVLVILLRVPPACVFLVSIIDLFSRSQSSLCTVTWLWIGEGSHPETWWVPFFVSFPLGMNYLWRVHTTGNR